MPSILADMAYNGWITKDYYKKPKTRLTRVQKQARKKKNKSASKARKR